MFFETCSNIPPPYWKLEAAGLGSWCRAGMSRSWVSSATVAVGADVVSTSLVFASLRICPPQQVTLGKFGSALIFGGGVIGDPVKFCTFRIFACTPCKFPFSANAHSGFFGGWGGVQWHALYLHTVRCYAIALAHMFDATQLHLHTCSMLRNCTCAHVRCDAIAMCTCSMLRNCTCAHVRCYAIAICTCSMLRNCTCAAVACAGTQCIDRFWQGLDDFIPASVVNKKQGKLNTRLSRLLTYVYSYMWRYHLPVMWTSKWSLVSWQKKPKRTEQLKKKTCARFSPTHQHVKHNRMARWYKENNGVIYHPVTLFSTWLATVNLPSGSGYFPECNFWVHCFCACHLSRSHYRSGSCPRPNHALVAAAMYLGVTSSRPPWGNPLSLPATSSSRQRSSSWLLYGWLVSAEARATAIGGNSSPAALDGGTNKSTACVRVCGRLSTWDECASAHSATAFCPS